MTRRRRLILEWLIFVGLLIGFAGFLFVWFHTAPAGPEDFSH